MYFFLRNFLLFLLLMTIPSVSVGEKETEKVKVIVNKTIEIHRRELTKNRKWEKKESALISELRSLKEKIERLENKKKRAEELLSNKIEKLKEQKRILKESVILDENIYWFMNGQIKRLDSFIKKDFPFLHSERQKRIKDLKNIIKDPDIKNSEKYRRISEAFRIETEYGDDVEVYKDNILINNNKVLVDILRIGRVTLLFSCLNSKTCGFYNPATKRFESLPEKYFGDIRNTIEISMGRRVPSIVRLPVGRIEIK